MLLLRDTQQRQICKTIKARPRPPYLLSWKLLAPPQLEITIKEKHSESAQDTKAAMRRQLKTLKKEDSRNASEMSEDGEW